MDMTGGVLTGEEMAVDPVDPIPVPGSPTEIAEESDPELEPKPEKRKREKRGDGNAVGTLDDFSDADLDSPSKKPMVERGEHPVTGRELCVSFFNNMPAISRRPGVALKGESPESKSSKTNKRGNCILGWKN